MTIKILEKTPGCLPEVFKVGDWVDLRLAKDVTLKAPYAKTLHQYRKLRDDAQEKVRNVVFDTALVPLGVCMELPKGFEAVIVPRSSTFGKYGILQTNSVGVIDYLYKGESDEWKMPMIATRAVTIPKGTRVAQFRIQLSQKASFWQKLKWLFSSSITIKPVTQLENASRGGFGSTGTK